MDHSNGEPRWMQLGVDGAEAYRATQPGPNGHRNGQENGQRSKTATVIFPAPIPASQLQKREDDARWLWKGYLARGATTLLSSLWKAGKSTLLSHLLQALGQGGQFCGQDVQPAKVLYVTEETEDIWADRRDELGLGDHVHFQVRPFKGRATFPDWIKFLDHIKALCEVEGYEVLVMDTISKLWPVTDENDNARVAAVLMPFWDLPKDLALLLNHHMRKSDGGEATASRGAGEIPAFVDIITELRRFDMGSMKDRRRTLTGYGRYRATPQELVVELAEDHRSYRACGDRNEATMADLFVVLDGLLPNDPPGFTYAQIIEEWPGDATPRKATLLGALSAGADRGRYGRDGEGKKGAPYVYWCPIPEFGFGSQLYSREPKPNSGEGEDRSLGW